MSKLIVHVNVFEIAVLLACLLKSQHLKSIYGTYKKTGTSGQFFRVIKGVGMIFLH